MRLAGFRNVVLTPHNAPGTRDVMEAKARDIWGKIAAFKEGRPVNELVED